MKGYRRSSVDRSPTNTIKHDKKKERPSSGEDSGDNSSIEH